MKGNERKKQILLLVILAVVVIGTVGLTYALYSRTIIGNNTELVAGDIYMHYNETKEVTISNAMPSATYSEDQPAFEFNITGKNTNSDNDIWYEIILTHGDVPEGKSEENRIDDKFLRFTLIETKSEDESLPVNETVLNGRKFTGLKEGKRIWVNEIPRETLEETKISYKLYMWIGDDIKIGNTEEADYDMDTWNNSFASIKINVNGDFEEKEVSEPLIDIIKNNVGSQGIVAVSNSGEKQETASNARELRYSGIGNYCTYNDGETDYKLSVEGNTCPKTACKLEDGSFISGDSDGFTLWGSCEDSQGTTVSLKEDSVQDSGLRNYVRFNDEMWRIVGVFEDKIKIIKDMPLTTGIPENYTSTGDLKYEFGIIYDNRYEDWSSDSRLPFDQAKYKYVMYNGVKKGERSYSYDPSYQYQLNDWTHSGLQYWLNEAYYKTIKPEYQNMMVDETYYLGNVTIDNSTYMVKGTAKDVYGQERGNVECDQSVTQWSQNHSCNLWKGNQATWLGKISLLYPSDYGYASDNSNWNKDMGEYIINGGSLNNWLFNTNAGATWFLSPSSLYPYYVMYWRSIGRVDFYFVDGIAALRPVVNLKSSVVVTEGDGSYNSPFVISE